MVMSSVSGSTIRLQTWFDRLQAGDDKARQELIEHYYQRFLTIVRQRLPQGDRLRKQENSQEILHDAFHKRLDRVLRSMPKPESANQFWDAMRAEIRRAIQDRARHHFKGKKARLIEQVGQGANSHDAFQARPDSDPRAAPDADAEWHEMLGLVGKILADDERRVFDLHLIEGMGWQEIAGALNVKEDTAKKKYFRALKKLQEGLKDKGYAE